eukprot:TRINITY_DN9838_c0_g3_i3.p1 TRINITY_DN9838_c0_g3~~TRINITY_DN9838_c0_g3_i3.p1  ORF type:complete len:198 (+),score=39.61 TRINITY_DN9838_c0_g3_i3:690-1283(+)
MVLSTFCWAVIDTLSKEVMSEQSLSSPYMLLSLWGTVTILFLWPFFFIFDATGLEDFQLPDAHSGGLVAATAVVSWIEVTAGYTVMWLITPLFITVSLSLGTPMAYLLDVFVNHTTPSTMKIFAIVGLLIGYLMLNLSYAGYEVGPVYYPCGVGGYCGKRKGHEEKMVEQNEKDEEYLLSDKPTYGSMTNNITTLSL